MRETIKEYLQNSGYHPQYDVIYYLPSMSQTVGGVHTVIDIINFLILEDIKAVWWSVLMFRRSMIKCFLIT